MVKKLWLLHMVTLYNTYTRYTHAHCQEFIAVKFLRGLVVIAISQLLDLRKKFHQLRYVQEKWTSQKIHQIKPEQSGLDAQLLSCLFNIQDNNLHKSYHNFFINPRRACAARVTVLGSCVCVCVCPLHFGHYE